MWGTWKNPECPAVVRGTDDPGPGGFNNGQEGRRWPLGELKQVRIPCLWLCLKSRAAQGKKCVLKGLRAGLQIQGAVRGTEALKAGLLSGDSGQIQQHCEPAPGSWAHGGRHTGTHEMRWDRGNLVQLEAERSGLDRRTQGSRAPGDVEARVSRAGEGPGAGGGRPRADLGPSTLSLCGYRSSR